MEELIDVNSPAVQGILESLLRDMATGKNILFATDAYSDLGEGFSAKDEITVDKLSKMHLQTRVEKEKSEQQERTRKKAEVFTPSWIVNKMNNYCDTEWFERETVFNTEQEQTWAVTPSPIVFAGGKRWQDYVNATHIEITCGEAPYIVSRYDTTTGEIFPIEHRIGFLDRKLRIVNENAESDDSWLEWTERAFESSYGYEYQGDNLLIARFNLLMTFIEYYEARFHEKPSEERLLAYSYLICYNLWQMDGLTGMIPLSGEAESVNATIGLFDVPTEDTPTECLVKDWKTGKEIPYNKTTLGGREMKFDFCIGNPAYHKDTTATSDDAIYNLFMDEAYKIATSVEMITPARFLFNAGKTPKEWNRKMLNDPHFKVLEYEPDATKVFPNTDIKGGVTITYHNNNEQYGAILVFSAYEELRGITNKVKENVIENNLTSIMHLQNRFNLSKLIFDFPEYKTYIDSNGRVCERTEKRIVSSSFTTFRMFTDDKETGDSVQILGIIDSNHRIKKWISTKYIEDNGNLYKWKVLVPKSNGSGALGEVLSTPLIGSPLIGSPLIGYTQSFIGIGAFDSEKEAQNAMKYVKSKFARTCLGILKVTQDNPPEKWQYVPLQDFTESSDIDWGVSVAEIDRQLYVKYGLTQAEIDFIETHVKEMA